jgi:hypothetical protein
LINGSMDEWAEPSNNPSIQLSIIHSSTDLFTLFHIRLAAVYHT